MIYRRYMCFLRVMAEMVLLPLIPLVYIALFPSICTTWTCQYNNNLAQEYA